MGRLERTLIARDPGLASLFGTVDHPVRAGDWIRQADLARALEGLAGDGAAFFYRGDLGAVALREVEARGGLLSREDLESHQTEECDPVLLRSGELDILEQPPVSQGAMVLAMLAILGEADRRGWSLRGDSPAIAQEMHLQAMAYRRAAEERDRWLCDPRFAREEARGRIDAWATEGFGREALASIDPHRVSDEDRTPAPDVPNTTYLCAVDREGNAVSWIQSIFHPFGAGWIVPGTGILLNNRMTGFATDPLSPNRLEPGKRTVHTLNTWMVLREGAPWLIGGTPGGEKQVQTNVQILRSRLAESRSLAESLRIPRWSIDEQDRLAVEARLPRDARRGLERRGHDVVRIGPWDGSGLVQAIERLPGGGWIACTDPRGEGLAAGF
jgi:gamma-glutamyltranspeptidase/glutathione hydrolase